MPAWHRNRDFAGLAYILRILFQYQELEGCSSRAWLLPFLQYHCYMYIKHATVFMLIPQVMKFNEYEHFLTLRGGTFRTCTLSPLLRKGCGETWNGCWWWWWWFSVIRGLFSQLLAVSSWVREDFLFRLSGIWSVRDVGGIFTSGSSGPASATGFVIGFSNPGVLDLLGDVANTCWFSFLL